MLEYVKMILLKVSFHKSLFEKELRKGLKALLEADIPHFRDWCYEQFAQLHRRVLRQVFGPVPAGTPLS